METENTPIVTVIAICYNHEKFLEESILSVLNQTYTAIQLIVVDDCSEDKSQEKIQTLFKNNLHVSLIFNEKNIGNCRSFNKALALAKGKYVIDLSTDDVLFPERIERQVRIFEVSEPELGVVFSNATFINEYSEPIRYLYLENEHIASGNVYEEVIQKSYILPSTMMIKKEVLEQLGGYDEALAYEDFDFWIRSSRNWKYHYLPEKLTFHRINRGSLSTKFVYKHNQLVCSTVKVCNKIMKLNRSETEKIALVKRLRLVLKQCVFSENFEGGNEVILMLNRLNGHSFQSKIFSVINQFHFPINRLYLSYLFLKRYFSQPKLYHKK